MGKLTDAIRDTFGSSYEPANVVGDGNVGGLYPASVGGSYAPPSHGGSYPSIGNGTLGGGSPAVQQMQSKPYSPYEDISKNVMERLTALLDNTFRTRAFYEAMQILRAAPLVGYDGVLALEDVKGVIYRGLMEQVQEELRRAVTEACRRERMSQIEEFAKHADYKLQQERAAQDVNGTLTPYGLAFAKEATEARRLSALRDTMRADLLRQLREAKAQAKSSEGSFDPAGTIIARHSKPLA